MLPTQKNHISFSEIKTWLDCSWKHKLVYIDKLSKYEASIFTDFGTIVHDAAEAYVTTRILDKECAKKKIEDIWKERGYPNVENWPTYASAVPELQYWLDSANAMLDSIPEFLDENYPGWEVYAAEEELNESIDGQDITFKGYVDVIIKTKNAKGKETFHILDWKTSAHSGWNYTKLKDTTVHLQLMLYKIFWSRKHNIDVKNVKCGFVLFKRLHTNKAKRKPNKATLVGVSLGPKTTERSLKTIRNMVKSLTSNIFLKNKYNCMFCEFFKTEHCKINL